MDQNNKQAQAETEQPPMPPNESTGIYVRGFVKISDPESGEVMVETGN